MPMYTYQCSCGFSKEELVTIAERNLVNFVCSDCGKKLKRIIDGAPMYAGEPYQMQAVLADGSKVKGHFGKEAPRVRKK